jgi:heme exporter protein A
VPRIPFIRTRDLTRTFGRHYALHRVGVRFKAGQVSLLLGPNGAGKSTLLSILATLDKPTWGRVEYGPDLSRAGMIQQGRGLIGWVSHDSLLYHELTAGENLDFYARLYRLDAPEKRVEAMLRRVGLESVGSRPVQHFSRGMRQRLSVGRALLNEPEVLILDEPLSGLDGDGRQRVVALLSEAKAQGKLVILSTHVLDLPEGFVDKVAVLRRGRLAYSGPVEGALAELYERVLEDRVPVRSGSAPEEAEER